MLGKARGVAEPGTVAAWLRAMTLLEFVLYVVIAGICGAIARAIAGGTGGGFVISVLLGFLGAFVGSWLARLVHLPAFVVVAIGGHSFPIVWSILGGFVLVALAHALMRRPRYWYVR
jgi:uncharacterized membrane protein YeaQ/YmgE (transglycosylase-associated protein family)